MNLSLKLSPRSLIGHAGWHKLPLVSRQKQAFVCRSLISRRLRRSRFHPGQILDYLMNPIDPEVTGMVMGEEPKSTVDSAAPFHPGQVIGRIGDAAKEIV